MSANEKLPPYKELETTAEFKCSRCKAVVYKESITETLNFDTNEVDTKRICVGSFYQAINKEGNASGPIIPFCNCGE